MIKLIFPRLHGPLGFETPNRLSRIIAWASPHHPHQVVVLHYDSYLVAEIDDQTPSMISFRWLSLATALRIVVVVAVVALDLWRSLHLHPHSYDCTVSLLSTQSPGSQHQYPFHSHYYTSLSTSHTNPSSFILCRPLHFIAWFTFGCFHLRTSTHPPIDANTRP